MNDEQTTARLTARLTAAMREADKAFETVGGSTRHFVNDCLLPALEAARLQVVDMYVPIHLEGYRRDVDSLSRKLDAADRLNAATEEVLAALEALLAECEGPVSKFEDRVRVMGDARAAIARARGTK